MDNNAVKLEEALKLKEKIIKSLKWLRLREDHAIRVMHRSERNLRKIRVKIVGVERKKELAKVCRTISALAVNNRKLSDS